MGHFYKEMGMYYCSPNKLYPTGHQHYFLGHHRDIEFYSDAAYCIETRGDKIELHACHHQQGSQYFHYDLDTQQLKNGVQEKNCLEANDSGDKVSIKQCKVDEPKQKWKWGRVNEDNLRKWKSVGARILD